MELFFKIYYELVSRPDATCKGSAALRNGPSAQFPVAMVRAAGVLALALAFAEAAAFLPPRAHLAPAHQRAQVCQRSGVRGLRQQGDYSLSLKSPMGIVFEEVEPGERKGVAVASLKPLGNAAADARILVGDKLISVSAAVMDKSNAPLFQLGQPPSQLPGTCDLHALLAAGADPSASPEQEEALQVRAGSAR